MSHLDCYAPLTYHDTPSMNIGYHDLSAREHGQSGSIYEPADVPFGYERLPRSSDYLCSLSVEGMGVTLEYSLYLARPYGTRKCWSIWCVVDICLARRIHTTSARPHVQSHTASADAGDDPEDIGRFLLLAALEVLNERRDCELSRRSTVRPTTTRSLQGCSMQRADLRRAADHSYRHSATACTTLRFKGVKPKQS